MPPSDTFFTAPPAWNWLVILYFFFGGIAGGSYFLAGLLRIFGTAGDRYLARLGFLAAFPAAVLCAPLLIVDLNRPERFWHMIIQSQTGFPMFKSWAPMSVGSWALLIFSGFAFLSFVGALVEGETIRWRRASFLCNDVTCLVLIGLGSIAGFFLASYTGVLLSVTNRPIWADSNLLGLLFLFSAASTSAALLILLNRWRSSSSVESPEWLSRVDRGSKLLELLTLAVLVISLGAVATIWLSIWGILLVGGVVILGIIIPLVFHFWPDLMGSASVVTAAVLGLAGGLLLRIVIVMSAQAV